MKKFEIDGFEVSGNSDMTEGRGFPTHIAFATSKGLADQIAIGQGPMGSPASVNPVKKTIYVYDTIEEYREQTQNARKAEALKKLKNHMTPDELKILGIKVD